MKHFTWHSDLRKLTWQKSMDFHNRCLYHRMSLICLLLFIDFWLHIMRQSFGAPSSWLINNIHFHRGCVWIYENRYKRLIAGCFSEYKWCLQRIYDITYWNIIIMLQKYITSIILFWTKKLLLACRQCKIIEDLQLSMELHFNQILLLATSHICTAHTVPM